MRADRRGGDPGRLHSVPKTYDVPCLSSTREVEVVGDASPAGLSDRAGTLLPCQLRDVGVGSRGGERAVAGRIEVTGHRTLLWAVQQPELVERYRSKIVLVPGSECWWWSGAVSGRGHGRFWLAEVDGRDIVAVAHRFGYALAHGVAALSVTRVLGHRCDNPLCQRMAPGHVVASSPSLNRREWAARRLLAGHPLGDPRGARGRSRALRDAVRASRELFELVDAAGRSDGVQLPLWEPAHTRAPGGSGDRLVIVAPQAGATSVANPR